MEVKYSETDERLLDNVRYFWEWKGDPTRYCSWEEALERFPDLKQAWNDMQYAEKAFTAILNQLDRDVSKCLEGKEN